MELAQPLNMRLDFGQSVGGRLILREPRIEDALELDVGVSQHLMQVALLKRVPHFLCGALALYKLGNVQGDSKADVSHHAFVVVVPVFLGSSCLVNVGLILDISISACDRQWNVRARLGKDLAATLGHDVNIHSL
jgi:hypothetical protein